MREAASIRSEHRYTTHHERESLRDCEEHAAPRGGIVATPVSSRLARASKRTTANSKRTLPREDLQQRVVCSIRYLVAEKVVHLVLGRIVLIVVRCIGRDGALDKSVARLNTGMLSVKDYCEPCVCCVAGKPRQNVGTYLLITYGGYVRFRTPGVGSVRPKVVVVAAGKT